VTSLSDNQEKRQKEREKKGRICKLNFDSILKFPWTNAATSSVAKSGSVSALLLPFNTNMYRVMNLYPQLPNHQLEKIKNQDKLQFLESLQHFMATTDPSPLHSHDILPIPSKTQ
jgi:hypothetical protein